MVIQLKVFHRCRHKKREMTYPNIYYMIKLVKNFHLILKVIWSKNKLNVAENMKKELLNCNNAGR